MLSFYRPKKVFVGYFMDTATTAYSEKTVMIGKRQ